MTRNQNFFIADSRDQQLAIVELTIEQLGIDTNVVFAIMELIQSILRQTKSPIFVVIARAVRNCIRHLGI